MPRVYPYSGFAVAACAWQGNAPTAMIPPGMTVGGLPERFCVRAGWSMTGYKEARLGSQQVLSAKQAFVVVLSALLSFHIGNKSLGL